MGIIIRYGEIRPAPERNRRANAIAVARLAIIAAKSALKN